MPPAAKDEGGARVLVSDMAAADVERVVLAVMPSDSWDDDEIGPRALQGVNALVAETPVAGWRVQVYQLAPAALPARLASFADGLKLLGADVPVERLSPGDVIPMYLRWQGGIEALRGSEKITLQLVSAGEGVTAQVDLTFDEAALAVAPASYLLRLPRTLPEGYYQLIVALYDPSQEGMPRLRTVEGSDHVVLKELSNP